MNKEPPSQSQIDKFRDAARELGTDDDPERFGDKVRQLAKAKLAPTGKHEKPSEPKVCPECGHVFQGNGWDGIDAHWKAKHQSVMPYSEAWPLIKCGTYIGDA